MLGGAKSMPAKAGFARFADQLGGVQISFGRNASAVQANAAQPLLAFDQDDFFALVGGVKGGGISAGPAPTTTISVLIMRRHKLQDSAGVRSSDQLQILLR